MEASAFVLEQPGLAHHSTSRPGHTWLARKHVYAARGRCHAATQTRESQVSTTDRLLQTVPGGTAAASLLAADRFWSNLCNSEPSLPREVIREVQQPLPVAPAAATFDVVVLGGTLGIFLACALQLKGKSVVVVERNALLGRDQEWNISRADMQAFVEEGVLTPAEVDEVLITEFNPVKVAFEGITEIVTQDVLNCGCSPKRIVEILKERFLTSGGRVMEGTSFQEACVHPDGVSISLTTAAEPGRREAGGAGGAGSLQMAASTSGRAAQAEHVELRGRVLVDAMGSFSPIAAQTRRGAKPDSVVLMVGSCATGLPECRTADLLYSFTPIDWKRKLQYFWEAFPASDGVTTYMFAYSDCAPGRATLRDMFEDYVEQLPQYQGCPTLDGVMFRRAMFGVVPNWHNSPPRPLTSRLLQIGDSAGNRSALSFAGFGAMARHLTRLRRGLEEALDLGLTDASNLQLLQPKSPAISMTAAMQFSMGIRSGQKLEEFDDQIINNYIGLSFLEMQKLGPRVYRPFMQDFLQWTSLSRIVGSQIIRHPGQLVKMTLFMRSPEAGAMFASNFVMLFVYDLLYRLAGIVAPVHEALLPAKLLYRWHRLVEAFEYGSANDYKEDAAVE